LIRLRKPSTAVVPIKYIISREKEKKKHNPRSIQLFEFVGHLSTSSFGYSSFLVVVRYLGIEVLV
jgi:hypothetical protein